jgi:hypothetical protein
MIAIRIAVVPASSPQVGISLHGQGPSVSASPFAYLIPLIFLVWVTESKLYGIASSYTLSFQ